MAIKKTFLLFCVLFSLICFSQQFPTVNNLSAKVLNNATVKIDFTIGVSTIPANGFELMRSTDSLFGYLTVYSYFGTVGGASSANYFYDDFPPDPTKIYYYKVRLSGGIESTILRVNMAEIFGEYKVVPHPIHEFSKLEFVYALGQQWVLEIADSKGIFHYRDEYVYTGTYPLSRAQFKTPGIYFFRLFVSDGSKVINGKIIII